MSIIGWWLGAASVANFVASMVLEIVAVWYPDFQIHHWHQYLIYVCLTWISVAANVFGSAWIPAFNKMLFVLSVMTLGSTMLTLFIVSRHDHADASFMFTDTTTSSGWSSDGWAFMLAVGNAVYAFLGSDCSAHLCEEIENPAKMVPRVIIWPLLMGLLTAFPFAVSLMYSISDLAAVFNTSAGLPLIEIYYQGTGSRVAASILLTFFAFCFFGNLVANGRSAILSLLPTAFADISLTSLTSPQHPPARSGPSLVTVPCRTPRPGPTSALDSRCPPTPCTSPQRSSQCVPIRPLHFTLTPDPHPALRPNFPRIHHSLLCHGQHLHRLSTDLVRDPASHPLVPGAAIAFYQNVTSILADTACLSIASP